ncbi:Endoplasmic reticulum-Golgi intermediate compartment protein 2 [Sarcoptes scabiei]|nr:Endoplasmic reticulum-Golgi intermediate compartment protein 2 [Sarcoptes scabiei]
MGTNNPSFLSKLDIFPKIDSSFTRCSPAGGTVSMLTYLVIGFVLFFETVEYFSEEIVYNYSVDTVFDKKLNINVDITLATPCSNVGADVMDSTNRHSMYMYGRLKETPIAFELDQEQYKRWKKLKQLNSVIRKDAQHLENFLKKPYNLIETEDDAPTDTSFEMISLLKIPNETTDKDSCRLHGTLTVNKVSGNFHIAAGKYLPIMIGHAHVSLIEYEKCNVCQFFPPN